MKVKRNSIEESNYKTKDIDIVTTKEIVKMINNEDKRVAHAVAKEEQKIAKVIDLGVSLIKKGGRIIYIGAGTSGRIGVLDASEIPPTFGEKDKFIGLIAGGDKALRFSIENAEDNKKLAISDLKKVNASKNDLIIGIAASGTTPYVISALEYAKQIGSYSVSIATSKKTIITSLSTIGIEIDVGFEVIAGSTRMKSGTAQKMTLNTISTGIMVKLGKTYSNLMIDLQSTNSKLEKRAIDIIAFVANCDHKIARDTFKNANKSVKLSIIMITKKISKEKAQMLLAKSNKSLRQILKR